MRKVLAGSLVVALLIVVGALLFVRALDSDRASAPQRHERSGPPSSEEVALAPEPNSIEAIQRLEVDDAPAVASNAICSLHGFVFPADGHSDLPLARLVELDDDRTTLEWARIEPSGAYALEHLVPGRYWLTAGSSFEDRAWTAVVLDPNVPSQRIDLRLGSTASLRIRVVDKDGRALDNRELVPVATSQPPGDWFDELARNHGSHYGVGRFAYPRRDDNSLGVGGIGCLLLDTPPPVYVSLLRGARVLETRLVDTLDGDVVFTIDRDSPQLRNAAVRWRIVDPISHENFCDHQSSSLERMCGEWRRFAESSASGVRMFGDLQPGPYELTLHLVRDEEHGCVRPFDSRKYHEFCDFSVSGVVSCGVTGPNEDDFDRTTVLRLDGGEDRDLGAIALTAGATITGHVYDAQGEPVHVQIDCAPFDATTGRAAQLGHREVWPDKDGAFRIRGIDPDEYLLSTTDRLCAWGTSSALVDVRRTRERDVELRVAPPVKCTLRPAFANWRAQRFELRNELGLPVGDVERFVDPRPRELLLAPGRYEVRTWILPSSVSTARTIEVATEPLAIDLP